MKVFIPPIGFELTLKKDWAFPLYHENRNISLLEYMGIKPVVYAYNVHGNVGYNQMEQANKNPPIVTLPKKTILKVDRIYIRQQKDDYNSVSFWATIPGYTNPSKSIKQRGKVRFWAKLDDVNRIEYV